ncbi:MAG: hypothetical protein AAGD35_23145, partial [Actinomycetota bacterium]
MTNICIQPGCVGGLFDADDYCNVCGIKADAGTSAPAAGSGPGDPSVAASGSLLVGAVVGPGGVPVPGDPCTQPPDCGGTFADDGYCDTCGLAAASLGGSARTAPTGSGPVVDPATVPSIAAPVPPTTSTRLQGASTGTTPSRRTVT